MINVVSLKKETILQEYCFDSCENLFNNLFLKTKSIAYHRDGIGCVEE